MLFCLPFFSDNIDDVLPDILSSAAQARQARPSKPIAPALKTPESSKKKKIVQIDSPSMAAESPSSLPESESGRRTRSSVSARQSIAPPISLSPAPKRSVQDSELIFLFQTNPSLFVVLIFFCLLLCWPDLPKQVAPSLKKPTIDMDASSDEEQDKKAKKSKKPAASSSAAPGRKKWTEEEEQWLIQGAREHGSSWNAILLDPRWNFGNRDNVQLKDKYRNLVKAGKIREEDLGADKHLLKKHLTDAGHDADVFLSDSKVIQSRKRVNMSCNESVDEKQASNPPRFTRSKQAEPEDSSDSASSSETPSKRSKKQSPIKK